jgi:hypothetical protein
MGTGGRNKSNEQLFEVVEAITFGLSSLESESNYKDFEAKKVNNSTLEIKMNDKTWIITVSEKLK